MAVVEKLGAALVLSVALVGCSSGEDGAAPPQGEPKPTFTVEERAMLDALHYDAGPPPADPSNLVADDPAAARFGQRLFYDPAFSGRLLEGDNDGTAFAEDFPYRRPQAGPAS